MKFRLPTGNRLAAILLVAIVSLSLAAFRQSDEGPLQDKLFAADDLYVQVDYLSDARVAGLGESLLISDLGELDVAPGGAYLDPRSGRWGTLMPATPLLPGRGNDLETRISGDIESAAWSALEGWLAQHADALGLDMDQLSLPAHVTVKRGGELIQVWVARRVDGVRVRDSYLTATINNGNLVLFGLVKWGDVQTASKPALDAAAARAVVDSHLDDAASLVEWTKRELVYVPVANGADPLQVEIGRGYGYRLAYAFHGTTPGELPQWEGLVDAATGNLLAFRDTAHYAADGSASLGSAEPRSIVGGVYPVSNDGVGPEGTEQVYPIPFAYVTNNGEQLTADSGGNVLACVDGTINTALTGPYLAMTDNCGAISESTSGSLLDLGTSGGIDCTTPPGASAGNTHASRSGFYEIGRIQEMGRSYLPENTWLQGQLPSEMNISSNCNATGGPGGLRFFTSGGGCTNTGEIAGVFDHEWGHGMDGADANPGISSPGEGIADIYASIRLNTSCIGRNFRQGNNCGGYGDPCTSCDGVRDINWANRVSGQPHDVNFVVASCPTASSTGPCGRSVHCEGATYAEAVYDLWNRDLANAPFGQDLTTARALATLLTFEGATNVGNWYTCTQNGNAGCNAEGGYLNYLAADDDDGNLANGTPHMTAINAAFARHGIACNTPSVSNSGCAGAPTVAPTVSASPFDRGAELTWNAVPGADTYRVIRNEGVLGCDFGGVLVAEVEGTSFNDTELANGVTYSYNVVAVGAGASCYGPASACTQVTPAGGANLNLRTDTLATSISGGDGDQFLDSCETLTVTATLESVGSGSLTNARIVDVRSPSHPDMDASVALGPGAAIAGTCNDGQVSFDIDAFDLDFNERVTLEIFYTADELGDVVKTATVELPIATESDLTPTFEDVTFTFESALQGWRKTSGTFDRTTAFGGGDGTATAVASSANLDSQCDKIDSPFYVPSATTSMTLWTQFDIEDEGGGWWDRANAAVLAEDGTRTVVDPSSGRDYNASGNVDFSACNDGEDGWGGSSLGSNWGSTGWNASALGSAGDAGNLMRIQMTYGTDGAVVGNGFRFDQVTLTNVRYQVQDNQLNCVSEILFADAFESGNLSAWSSATP